MRIEIKGYSDVNCMFYFQFQSPNFDNGMRMLLMIPEYELMRARLMPLGSPSIINMNLKPDQAWVYIIYVGRYTFWGN